jgi:hypothetical protein
MDTTVEQRIIRAQELRRALSEPTGLVETARELLAVTPGACTHLVAFSPEGHAVAAAAAALASVDGRELGVERASHVAPLHPGPASKRWRWMSVEEGLDLGPVRPWVAQWAVERGGGEPLAPSVRGRFAQVA